MSRTRARAALLVAVGGALGVAACGADVGPTSPWTPLDQISGPLVTERGDGPQMQRASRIPGDPLRVVTYNVYKGKDVDGLVAAIRGDAELAHADIFFIQEIEAHPGEGGSRASRLAQGLGMSFIYVPARVEGDGTHGLAILSALPLRDAQVMRLPDIVLPFSDAARIAVSATVDVDGVPVRLINVHLDTRLNVPERILQLRPAALDAPDPVILGGDLNTNAYVWAEGAVPSLPVETVSSPDHQARALDDYLHAIGYRTPTALFGATQHTPVVDSRLDALVLRGLNGHHGAVARDIGESDHWPVWLDVTLE